MKKILALLPAMLLSLLLSSCIVEEPEENHRPTRGIYEAFEYVRNANRPMLDALFITYRMQEYNRLQTDSARQAFRKTYLRDMTVKDTVSKENSFNPMYILTDRKSDYFYTQYTITDYRYNYLRIECTTYLYKTKTHRMFDVHQQSDGSWRIDNYVIHPTTSTDDSSKELYWADLFSVANRFYVWGSAVPAGGEDRDVHPIEYSSPYRGTLVDTIHRQLYTRRHHRCRRRREAWEAAGERYTGSQHHR